MKKKLTFILALIALGASAFACEMGFLLLGPDGSQRRITPDADIELISGREYELRITFTQDHGRCDVPAEDTVFLLNGEKWKPDREDSALAYRSSVQWTDISAREHEARIPFTVRSTGEIQLEIIRECAKKDGYDEVFSFFAE